MESELLGGLQKPPWLAFITPTGVFVCWGSLGSSFREHISGQRQQDINTHSTQHTAHGTDLLCLQALPCPRLCSFDRRPAGQKNKQRSSFLACHGYMHASVPFFLINFWSSESSTHRYQLQCAVVVFQPFSELGPMRAKRLFLA